jgi:hypothetical protein
LIRSRKSKARQPRLPQRHRIARRPSWFVKDDKAVSVLDLDNATVRSSGLPG